LAKQQKKKVRPFDLRKIREDRQIEMIPTLYNYLQKRVGIGGMFQWSGWTKTLTHWYMLRQSSREHDPFLKRNAHHVINSDVYQILEVCAAGQRLDRLSAYDRTCVETLLYLIMEFIWWFSWWHYER